MNLIIKEEETREERFKRIAEKRTKAAMDKIRLIRNLSNRGNYDYSEDDVRKIFTTLKAELKAAEQSFITNTSPNKFKL